MQADEQLDRDQATPSGALLEAELQSTVVAAGFTEFEIAWKAKVFDGAPQASSAAVFGTVGINFRATKP